MTTETILVQLARELDMASHITGILRRMPEREFVERWSKLVDHAKDLLAAEAANPAPHVWQLWFAGESEITQDPEEAARWRADGYTVHELGRVLVSSIPKENLI